MNLTDLKPFQDRLILLQKQLWRLLIGLKHFHFWKISIGILMFQRAQFQAIPRTQSSLCYCANNEKQRKWCKAMMECVPSSSWRHEWELTQLNHFFLINDSVLIKPNHSSIAHYTAVKLLPAYWWLRLRKVIGLPSLWHYQRFPPITNLFLPPPQTP